MNHGGLYRMLRSVIVSATIVALLSLSSGCMLMHAFDGHFSADRVDSPAMDVVSTLKRVEEILATQRILAAALPESRKGGAPHPAGPNENRGC